jgi:hypothetical protein
MNYTTEIDHALVVRDLARAVTGFTGGGDAFFTGLRVINGVANGIKPAVTLRSPIIRHIKARDPELWSRLKPYVEGWK